MPSRFLRWTTGFASVVCFTSGDLFSAPTTIVDWGGNYVASHSVHGHASYDGTSSDDWVSASVGSQGFSTRPFDLNTNRDLTPGAGYTAPPSKSSRFYGGYSSACNLSPAIPGGADGLTAGYRDVEQNGSSDRIVLQCGAGNQSKIRGAVVFRKDDFLQSSAGKTVSLDFASELFFSGILDGWRPEARWLVRDGDTWYISQATLAAQGSYNIAEGRTLLPSSTQWAVYNPVAVDGTGNAYFPPVPASFSAHVFSDVTAVGIFFDSFNASGYLGGASFSRFALEQFKVKAQVAEPTVAVDWGGDYVSTHRVHGHAVYDGSVTDDWGIATSGSQGFVSRILDMNSNRDLTPTTGYTAPPLKSSKFFGGYSGALNLNPALPGASDGLTSGFRDVEQNGSSDRIVVQVGAGNRSKVRGAIVFRKEEFLRDGQNTTVSFDSSSELSFSGILDGWRPEARWLVRDGSTWYLSQATLSGQSAYNVAETRSLRPSATQWATFNPNSSGVGGTYFSAAPSSFAPRSFTDVRAVGVYFDSFGAASYLGGTSFSRFALEQFKARTKMVASPVTVLASGMINGTVGDEVFPTSMVKAGNGDLILAYCSRGDIPPGSGGYLTRSSTQGNTWSPPFQTFQSADPKIGTMTTIARLPDGSLLLGLVECIHPAFPSISHRYTQIEMRRSTDNGNTFDPWAVLPIPNPSITCIMGPVCQLPNGDLILPGYVHQGEYAKVAGYNYGCGFFRSTNGGVTWGPLEVAFQDPPTGVASPLEFTEATFVVGPDDDTNPLNDPIVAMARIDTDPTGQYSGGVPNSMWRTTSVDNGGTWSNPEPVGISGIYPAAIKVRDHSYLMVCGDRQASPSRRVSFFTGRDAKNYTFRGHPPVAPYNTATGGGQAVVELSPGIFYVAYYTSALTPNPYDPPNMYYIYLEGCKIQVGQP